MAAHKLSLYKMFTKLGISKSSDEELFDDVLGFDDLKEIFQMQCSIIIT